MITKERREELVQALENGDPVDCDAELLLRALLQIGTLETRNRALKREIRNLHRAREQDWEAGKRWRKEFIEYSERLRAERLTSDKRIAELEAAAQWRPIEEAPQAEALLVAAPGTCVLRAYWSEGEWRQCGFEPIYFAPTHFQVLPKEPIPALPEGGV